MLRLLMRLPCVAQPAANSIFSTFADPGAAMCCLFGLTIDHHLTHKPFISLQTHPCFHELPGRSSIDFGGSDETKMANANRMRSSAWENGAREGTDLDKRLLIAHPRWLSYDFASGLWMLPDVSTRFMWVDVQSRQAGNGASAEWTTGGYQPSSVPLRYFRQSCIYAYTGKLRWWS
ncbi:hypothetical protein HDK77DRAFT_195537 [Phyllosticta capitalensis]